MLRRALKHAALAAALLVPTLAGVVALAPAAHASGTATVWPTGSGTLLGESRLDVAHFADTPTPTA